MADHALDRHPCCRVLELRQYTLHPGGRDVLSSLFDRYFLDELAATGMHASGLFADVEDMDRLVWMRGFTDMVSRHRALSDFYLTGQVWREHAAAANATMIDSDDVLLLAPAYLGAGFPVPGADRLTEAAPDGGLVVEVLPLQRLAEVGVTPELVVDQVLEAAGAEETEVLLVALTHPEPNDFLGLPVRDEQVAVWLARYPDPGARARVRSRLPVRPDDERVHLRPLTGSQIR
jgi:hypothetical protein